VAAHRYGFESNQASVKGRSTQTPALPLLTFVLFRYGVTSCTTWLTPMIGEERMCVDQTVGWIALGHWGYHSSMFPVQLPSISL
jgi:hypothetical protein